jgi:hypothetical protein
MNSMKTIDKYIYILHLYFIRLYLSICYNNKYLINITKVNDATINNNKLYITK